MKTTVIHHSADYDGIFCREIARKFLPAAELIGWDYKDPKIPFPEGIAYVLDLSPECFEALPTDYQTRLIWIDHHKTAIEKWPSQIVGFRIDGVAACRLAWQWFSRPGEMSNSFPKSKFIEREVNEPVAVRLAGEYDIWDKRDIRAEWMQYGLRSFTPNESMWAALLRTDEIGEMNLCTILRDGATCQNYQQNADAGMMHRSFLFDWEGLKFLALNTARCNSLTFMAKDVPETAHDALLGFYWDGGKWNVSLYHAKHRTDLDLSKIAVKYGGGGHRGACGFALQKLSWVPS